MLDIATHSALDDGKRARRRRVERETGIVAANGILYGNEVR